MSNKEPSIQTSSPLFADESALEMMRRIADASATATCGDAGFELEESSIAVEQAIARSDLANRLRSAIDDAATKDASSLEALRIAVCEFTLALRDEGTTPEAVLINLKSVIDRKSLPILVPHDSAKTHSKLRETMSTWCIQAYFKQNIPCV